MYRVRDNATIMNMKPLMEEAFARLAEEVERSVPPSGKFDPLYASFEDTTGSLDIVNWSMKCCDLIYNGCGSEVLSRRYLELVGYLGGGYCITRVVGLGSVAECAALLRSRPFVDKVMEAMKSQLGKCDDFK